MITKIKGKTWKIAQDSYHWQVTINKESALYNELADAFPALAYHLETLKPNTNLARPYIDSGATTLLKEDFWRIAKQDNWYFVQTRTKKSSPWVNITENNSTATVIGIYDNPESAVLRIIKWLTSEEK
jgi:CTP:phosphocholine cytidylyltransferase-like protein